MYRKNFIATFFGINPSKLPSYDVSVKCPFHNDEHSSAGINFRKELFNCFVCGGLNFSQLYKKLKGKRNVSKEKKKIITPEIEKLQERGIKYLEERGINKDNIPLEWEVCDIYMDKDGEPFNYYGYLMFEGLDGYITGRNLIEEVEGRPKYLNEPNQKGLLWISKDPNNKVIFLVEGIFDGLSLYELGIRNIACSMGAQLPKKSVDDICYGLKDNTVLVIYDNDPKGFIGSREVSQELTKFEVDHAILELPKILGKDINEALVNDRDKLTAWVNTVIERFSPNDTLYSHNLFRGKIVEPLNILPTGIKEIDKLLTGGFKDGGHIISGTTGIGKTAFVFYLGINGVLHHNKKVMVNSCEISKRQSWARIASRFSKYTWEELEENPHLLEDKTYQQVKEISKGLLVVNGWPLKRIIQEAKDFDVIIIDYIQRVREAYGGDQSATRYLINNYVSSLTDLGALQGKICIMVSSIGRASYDKPNEYGLKESGSIEFMGTTVSRLISIGDPMQGHFIWNVQKNNRGDIGRVRIKGVDLGHIDFFNLQSEKVKE